MAETVRTDRRGVRGAAGTAGYVVGFDAVSSFGVFLPVGEHDDIAYAVLAPHSQDDEPAYGDPYNVVPVPTLPAELVDLVSTVRATGDVDAELVLPDEVSGVELQNEVLNVGAAPGARVSSADGGRRTSSPSWSRRRRPASAAGTAGAGRTFWLQDARPPRWTRLDVLVDAAGCRTAVSELGGTRVHLRRPGGGGRGTPARRARRRRRHPATHGRQAHGLSVAVPEGWQVVRDSTVDPCTLAGPSVVVADELAPSCYAALAARPTQPFALGDPEARSRSRDASSTTRCGPRTARSRLDWSRAAGRR